MQTERFNKLRRNKLESIFNKNKIVEVWRRIVKNQLRALDIKDLFDYYDLNYNISDRAITIRNDILKGTYKVSQPYIYRVEKKYGVCRHLVIPQPTDALVLQVLIESIADDILNNQPSKNAFYSRDKHNVSKPHEVGEYPFTWRQQWKKLQKKIYKFNDEKELIVVTDLSNYYDSIDTKELRKVFTSYSKLDEVLVDLLFRILEEISWKPDYLPYSARGLPTTNIEGIRLLAHSFLFELDEVIKQKTNNSFTRWMDDIVIGVNSRNEANEILSSISDMLKSRGLALNIAKTNIYDASQGYYHFQIKANRYIDLIEKTKVSDPRYNSIVKKHHQMFMKHFKDQNADYWEKIAKRFITTYGKLKTKKLLNKLPNIYIEYPNLRPNLLLYLLNIGYSKLAAAKVIEIVKCINLFDDISLYQLCLLVTKWEAPINKSAKHFLKEFEEYITSLSFKRKQPSDFYSLLWFKAKYSKEVNLLSFIIKYKNIWQTDTFLRRQVTSVIPRLLTIDSGKGKELLNTQVSSGIINTVTIANQILQFSKITKLDRKLNQYLFPNDPQTPYPLQKFLVLCSVLNSDKLNKSKSLKDKIKHYIKDPYYLKWLRSQYNIS